MSITKLKKVSWLKTIFAMKGSWLKVSNFALIPGNFLFKMKIIYSPKDAKAHALKN